MSVVIKYNGEDITDDVDIATAMFHAKANGQVGSAYVKIKDTAQTYIPLPGKRLTCAVDGDLKWSGVGGRVQKMYAFPAQDTDPPGEVTRYWVIEGVDDNILFDKRIVFDSANPATHIDFQYMPGAWDDDIINDIFDNYLDLAGDDISRDVQRVAKAVLDIPGITSGRGTSKTLADHEGTVHTGTIAAAGYTWKQAMDVIRRATGAIYYIDGVSDPDERVFRYVDVETVTATDVLTDTPTLGGDEPYGYREFDILENGINLTNDMHVWGAALGAKNLVHARFEDDDSLAAHGRWEDGLFSIGLYRQLSVDTVAESWVSGTPESKRGKKDPQITFTCRTFMPVFKIGQVVSVSNSIFDFEEDLPLREMRITFRAPWIPIFDLVLGHEIDQPWSFYEELRQKPRPIEIQRPNWGFPMPSMRCCIDPFTRTVAGEWSQPPICFDPWDHYYCVITPTDEWRVLDDFERTETGEWGQPTGTHASFGALADWSAGGGATPPETYDVDVNGEAGVLAWTLPSTGGQIDGSASITVPRASLGGLSPANRDIVNIQFVFQYHSDFVHSYDPPGPLPTIYNEQVVRLLVGYSDNINFTLVTIDIQENYDPGDLPDGPQTLIGITGSGSVVLPLLTPDEDHTVLFQYVEQTSGLITLDGVEYGPFSNTFTLPTGNLKVAATSFLNVSSDGGVNEGSLTIKDIQTFVTTYPCVDTPPVGLSVDGDQAEMAGPLTEIGGDLVSRLNLTEDGATAVALPLDVTYTILFSDLDGRFIRFIFGDAFLVNEAGNFPIDLNLSWGPGFYSTQLSVGSNFADNINVNESLALNVPYKVRLRLGSDLTGYMKFWLASDDEPCLWMSSAGPYNPASAGGTVDGGVGAIGVAVDLPREDSGDTVGSTIRFDSVKVCIGPSAGDGGLFDGGSLADDKDDAPVLTDPPGGMTVYSVDPHTQTEDATDPTEFASRGDNTSWLKLVLTEEMDLRFDTVGSTYDTYLYVYQGASPPGTGATSIYSDDDDGPGNTSAIPSMTGFVTLAAGTYWLVVLPFSSTSLGSAPDTSVIRVSRDGCDPIASDDDDMPAYGPTTWAASDTGDQLTYSLGSTFSPGSTTVWVNGVAQIYGATKDYTEVPGQGEIVFNSPLDPGDEVVVAFEGLGPV